MTLTLRAGDCAACGHDSRSHNDGTCRVLSSGTPEGTTVYEGGCGCQAMPLDMTCPTCRKRFVCGLDHAEAHDCLACYEKKKDATDRDSFAPLVAALRQEGVYAPDQPWNTGGNVMCLAVELVESPAQPYILFSDDADLVGFGLYIDSEHTGINFDPPFASEYGDERYDKGWATPGLAERVAAWTAACLPGIVDWLGTITYETEEQHLFGETYTVYHAVYEGVPEAPEGTTVIDFERS